MNRKETIHAFCRLTTEVGERVFSHQKPHDCFCHESKTDNPVIDDEIVNYIREAVMEKLRAPGLILWNTLAPIYVNEEE